MTWALTFILAIFFTILVGLDLTDIKVKVSSPPFFVMVSYIKNMVIIGLIFYYLRKADLKIGLGMPKSNDTIS
jgi:hypothetical protein